MVRSKKKYGKSCIEKMAINSKISLNVGFWRFRKLFEPKKNYNKSVSNFINIVEKR